MNLWDTWLDTLRMLLDLLTFDLGLGVGGAVIVTTLLIRSALLPISWTAAYRGAIRQRKMKRLQPLVDQLKAKHADDAQACARELMALHKAHGVALVDGKALLGGIAQLPVFVGMFRLLRGIGEGTRFWWIPNLARPDALLAIIAGLTTALMAAANPDMPEQMRMILIVVPGVIAIASALHFSSALAIYWITSNLFSATQTMVLHSVVNRRMRNGGSAF